MKRVFAILFVCLFVLPVFCEDVENESTTQNENTIEKAKAGVSVVPSAKKPITPDKEKSDNAALNDDNENVVNEYKDTLKFGLSTEIVSLLQKFIDNDDPRFTNDVYDLFQTTRAYTVREKIFEYYAHFKDPCVEDYAVEILNDPYDTKNSTVEVIMKYISEVKCKAAIPAIISIMETDNVAYFQSALTALGEIGSSPEALYLSDYIDRDDLSLPQRQALARVLGNLKAVETWDKLSEMAQNEDENAFVRMYCAESIGKMKLEKSIPILVTLYESADPNFRQYVLKGLRNFPESDEAKSVIMQGIKDEHYKVRLEAIDAVKEISMKEASSYLIYRAKNDSEKVVQKACYDAIASLGTNEGKDYLISIIKDKKASDATKAEVVQSLMKIGAGEKEILTLAQETLDDNLHKPLRYAIGKELAKVAKPSYANICFAFLSSTDAMTVSLGLDMYKKGRYDNAKNKVQEIADDTRKNNNKDRARKILGLPEKDEATNAK